jgi:hypothetical protein
MNKFHKNTTREILLLKEFYGVSDSDPIFLFLQGYGKLQDKMVESIGGVNELEKLVYAQAEQLLENTVLVNRINEELEENLEIIKSTIENMPSFAIDELRGEISYVREEINKLGYDARELHSSNQKYNNSIGLLAKNADTFSKIMKTIQSKHWLIFIGIGITIVLQLLVLLVLLGKVH